MKVACPHCSATYEIDDRRVPEQGLDVRCPKCRNAFPVRRGQAAAGTTVPLPAPSAAPAAARPPVPMPPATSGLPVPLPAPTHSAPAIALGEPFAPPGAVPDATADAMPVEPPEGSAASLGFGEIDLRGPSAAAPLPGPDPFQAPAAPGPAGLDPFQAPAAPALPSLGPFQAGASPPPPADELETLFGDGTSAATRGAGARFKVRRRSGKVFGPFEEKQIADMLSKGELLGNEDVSSDDGATWTPFGAVPAFAEALRKIAGEAPPGVAPTTSGPHEPQRLVPYGNRMASAKVTTEPERGRRVARIAVPAAVVAALLAAGAGAGLTRYGFFFLKAFRRADAAKMADLTGRARAALAKADYPSERGALALAAEAVAADPGSADAAALHAAAVAALELRHAAPPAALEEARRTADRLEKRDRGEVPALAARLAVTLATAPGPATASQESALETAASAGPPDPEHVALLARAALARGDAARAAALFGRLEPLEAAAPRAPHGLGLALHAKGDVAGAKAAFERALSRAPDHFPSRLELAAIADLAGDAVEAEAKLAPLLAEGADARLAPSERARALALRAGILGRRASSAAEADRAFEAAVQADPRLVEVRVAFARHRIRRGDPAGAVAALDPVAQVAASVPAIAAVRIRALALAGRALDASSLADQALQRSPGDPALLLAKAGALEASAKPDEAAAVYQDVAARDPAAFEPRLALARIALGRHDLPRASAEIAAAVEKGPRSAHVQATLGEVEAAKGDAARAEASFRASLAIDPEHVPAEVGLAKLAAARGDAAGARARLERALAVDPRNVDGRVAYGTLLWKEKDLAGAEKELQAAVESQPRNVLALMRLGQVELERGEDVDGAVQRLTAASNEDPRDAEAHQWLGRALLKKGETPGAIQQLKRAVALEPQGFEHRLHLGAALERAGSLGEAADEYRAAAVAAPKLPDAHEKLGMLYAANGRCDEAVPPLERAVAAAPKVSRLRMALGECKAKLGKNDEAVRIYRDVMRIDRGNVQVYYRLARAMHEGQGARAALPWYERAARDDAQNPMPHYYLGYLYKERGQRQRAKAEFKAFLRLKPDAEERSDIEAEIDDLDGAQ